ncbi:MAG: argininosuccinate lyase [Clostridiales bacterium]|nr:argininosuccinate lyase [Clostridiales bacterium]
MKLWAGRFSKSTASSVDEFNASIEFDKKLYKQDILGSIAHAKMLSKQGIIPSSDASVIIDGLHQILEDIEAGKIEFKTELEDIHMNIEKLLTDRIGDVGKKLHTARSRNDQVAVDIRLYVKDAITDIQSLLMELLQALVSIAEKNTDTILPGYTHLQRAQPVTLAYHMLAYFQMFSRDHDRLSDSLKRTDSLPLGSGALAGTTYETDRDFLAKELNFSKVCPNAMDAVSDRDFAIEFISSASILMMHLSRFCEELILWSSSEFNFIEMDDAYSTGSSIMPQKKNPDIAELIRGKTGRVYGNLINILTIMKSLPLAYNKDMQEDKPPLFDTVETLKSSLPIFVAMIQTMKINKEKMYSAAKSGFLNATDAADYLVSKGIPFRECHEIIGRLVLHCIQNNKAIEELSLDELKRFSDRFEEDVYEKISIENCIAAKKSSGSTSIENVAIMIEQAKKLITKN